MLDQIMHGSNGIIDEWMWRRVIEKMYDQEDAEVLEQRFA